MVKTVATILSYGMGVESSAILLRWIMSPATRPCPLEDLIVITSQVGDEYTDTGRDVNTHILPLMGALGIRYVQVARHGHFGSAQETVKACPFIGFGLERFCPGALGLGGHLKTGHRGSPQNRPTGRGQDMRLLYRVGGRRGKKFLI